MPRIAKNLLKAQTNELVSIDSNTSMWTALLLKQVNTTPHRFELAAPPRVFLYRTIHGPKTSMPTLVKGRGDFSPVSRQVGHTTVL